MKKTKFLAEAALIGTIYFILTAIPGLSAISFGPIQIRVSEMLTVLPFIMPSAIPGLTVGCFLSNLILSPMKWDILFGTSATLLAAVCTYLLSKCNFKGARYIAPLPPVLFNAVIVGLELKYFLFDSLPLYLNMLFVGAGQIVSCYILGLPLLHAMERYYLPAKLR
jgi:uncharacterized membrane protein